MDRRAFLKTIGAFGAASVLHSSLARAREVTLGEQYFSLHPFIEAHPEAVFIMHTSIGSKLDADAKRQAGSDFAASVFTLSTTTGIPFSHLMAVKPNLTCTSGLADTVENMGIRTDTAFMEGLIEGVIRTGFPAGNISMREGNWMGDGYCPDDRLIGGMMQVAERTGTHLLDFPGGRTIDQLQFASLVEGQEVVWKDVPDGTVLRRVGYLWPFNLQDSWILNVAKFKTHSMGMTLCTKNLQGSVVSPLVRFCETVDSILQRTGPERVNFQPDVEARIDARFASHTAIPRWQRPGRGSTGGYGMETWAQRTCDSHSVMNPGLHVIEGLYGRNGNGFQYGPGPGGLAEDFLSNIIVFGKNSFLVDVIGSWLAGHEPGNFGLFHIAKERGLMATFDPHAIPVYAWRDGAGELTPLSSLTRTPLLCPYLRRDYGGMNEAEYHLVDEPYEYNTDADTPPAVDTCILGQNHANPFRGSTIIDYSLPRGGHVTIEVFDAVGRKVDVLVDDWRGPGSHMVQWEASQRPSGMYVYRMRSNGHTRTRNMVVR